MTRCAFTLLLAAVAGACWRIGEPTTGDAVVSWAAFPDTVVAGELFSLEFAGPITPDACGRLDTAVVAVSDSTILLTARRSTFDTMCPDTPISFYEARPLELAAGSYRVSGADREFGRITVLEDGRFSPMTAVGEGTVNLAGGCLLFGPGRLGNQRPFALIGAGDRLAAAVDADRVAWVRGRLAGFTLCGSFGSRPAIRVEEAVVRDGTSKDNYGD